MLVQWTHWFLNIKPTKITWKQWLSRYWAAFLSMHITSRYQNVLFTWACSLTSSTWHIKPSVWDFSLPSIFSSKTDFLVESNHATICETNVITHLIKGWKKQERSVNTVANTSVSMNILTVHLKQVILTEIDAQPLLQHVSVITMHWGLRHPAVHLENWTCECTYHEELELCRREEITQMGKISANKLMSAQNRVYFERQLMNDGVHSTFTMSRCVNQWNSRAWQAERLRR